MKMMKFRVLLLVLICVTCNISVYAASCPTTPETGSDDYKCEFRSECTVKMGYKDADGFDDRMSGFAPIPGLWNKLTCYRGWKVWETDYKRQDMSGPWFSNQNILDLADLHYHIGHGGWHRDKCYNKWLTALIFSNTNKDDKYLDPSDARNAWGDKDLEWIGSRACKMLNDASRWYWARTMNGVHLICGFKTSSYEDNNFGFIWADRMCGFLFSLYPYGFISIPQKSVTQAWFTAADKTQPGGWFSKRVVARVLAETKGCFNEKIGDLCCKTSGDHSPDRLKWCLTHPVRKGTSQTKGYVPYMKTYEVDSRTVDAAYVAGIADNLGFFPGQDETNVIGVDKEFYMVYSDGLTTNVLSVCKNTGLFCYQDISKLYIAQETAPSLPSEYSAISLAGSYLSSNGLLPSDATTATVTSDLQEKLDIDAEIVEESFDVSRQVCFERQIEAETGKLAIVTGPGARLSVTYGYGDTSDPVGVMGGWRDIVETGTVEVRPEVDAWNDFVDYGQQVNIAQPYAYYDEVQRISSTLGYYEHGGFTTQIELIPVWIFEVDFKKDGEIITTDDVYIPANTLYCDPVVQIDSPADVTVFGPDEVISFQGSVVKYGTSPFTYEWYSDSDGLIGTGASFSKQLSVAKRDETIIPHTISLVVTDDDGRTNEDSISITVGITAVDQLNWQLYE